MAGSQTTITVDVSLPQGSEFALLNAWIDFDHNGSWNTADQVLKNVLVTAGSNILNVDIPSDAGNGVTYARFRLSSIASLTPHGLAPDGEVEDYRVEVQSTPVKARYIFYNESAFDSNSDDEAIATDKFPLLPGPASTFDNYINHPDGVTGIMVDIVGLTGTPSVADFTFRAGNDNNPSNWPMAPSPAITRHPGAGDHSADRIKLIWPAGSIVGAWLQVTMNENVSISLPSDVFYVGSAPGESGDNTANAFVNGFDFAGARDNPTPTAAIDNPYDYNRDRHVDGADAAIARDNATNFRTALQLISVPAAAPAAIVDLVIVEPLQVRSATSVARDTIEPTCVEAVDAAFLDIATLPQFLERRPVENLDAEIHADERALAEITFELHNELEAST